MNGAAFLCNDLSSLSRRLVLHKNNAFEFQAFVSLKSMECSSGSKLYLLHILLHEFFDLDQFSDAPHLQQQTS